MGFACSKQSVSLSLEVLDKTSHSVNLYLLTCFTCLMFYWASFCSSHCQNEILKLMIFPEQCVEGSSDLIHCRHLCFLPPSLPPSPLFSPPSQGAWVQQWNLLLERAFLLWMLWLKWYVGSVKGQKYSGNKEGWLTSRKRHEWLSVHVPFLSCVIWRWAGSGWNIKHRAGAMIVFYDAAQKQIVCVDVVWPREAPRSFRSEVGDVEEIFCGVKFSGRKAAGDVCVSERSCRGHESSIPIKKSCSSISVIACSCLIHPDCWCKYRCRCVELRILELHFLNFSNYRYKTFLVTSTIVKMLSPTSG